jgi:hypothetical protein
VNLFFRFGRRRKEPKRISWTLEHEMETNKKFRFVIRSTELYVQNQSLALSFHRVTNKKKTMGWSVFYPGSIVRKQRETSVVGWEEPRSLRIRLNHKRWLQCLLYFVLSKGVFISGTKILHLFRKSQLQIFHMHEILDTRCYIIIPIHTCRQIF